MSVAENGAVQLLDCTLRDGGYITNWRFCKVTMENVIRSLTDAGVDYIECGYLNPRETETGKAIFQNCGEIESLLPPDRKKTTYLAMADCAQITAEEITPYTGKSIDGIRVVFYKHQIEQALQLCESVRANGYRLFIQPMVTIDYTFREYETLIQKMREFHPDGISIVDSFGYMGKDDFRAYFQLLDEETDAETIVGFHSHNNMQLAFVTAQDVFSYRTERKRIIDASLYGMGRGAGNLNLEVIANFYNMTVSEKYDVSKMLTIIGEEIEPIRKERTWGYTPYLFLTGKYHCHPNFACFLLERHNVSVAEFEEFVQYIPEEMRTKCRREYVEELYREFAAGR